MFTNRFSHLMVVMLLVVALLAACAPAATPAATSTPVPPTATPDPNEALVGTWTSTVTKEDLLRVDPYAPAEHICENTGTFVWKFNGDGTFAIDQTALEECPSPNQPHIEDTWSLDGNLLTFAKGTPNQEVYAIAIDGDHLTFKVEFSECPPCMAINTANPWTRLE
jgi:hypothetical protein